MSGEKDQAQNLASSRYGQGQDLPALLQAVLRDAKATQFRVLL
jgi:hypothetical protein